MKKNQVKTKTLVYTAFALRQMKKKPKFKRKVKKKERRVDA